MSKKRWKIVFKKLEMRVLNPLQIKQPLNLITGLPVLWALMGVEKVTLPMVSGGCLESSAPRPYGVVKWKMLFLMALATVKTWDGRGGFNL